MMFTQPRVTQWSVKQRDEQTRICEKYVLPVIADVSCRELTRADLQEIINSASTASVAHHIRRTLTALRGSGLEEGYVMVGRDLLRGIRWQGETVIEPEPVDPAVTEDEIPTVAAVHELAAATAALTGCGGASCRSSSSPTAACGGANMSPSRGAGRPRPAPPPPRPPGR